MLAGDTATVTSAYMHDCALTMLATWHSKEQGGLLGDMPWPIACSPWHFIFETLLAAQYYVHALIFM